MTSSVLVLGLGELGFEVVRSLASHPHRSSTAICALLRTNPNSSADPERQRLSEQLRTWNVQVITADVVELSEDQLAEVFGAFQTVISCNGMTLPPDTQTKLAAAAIKGGVKRYFPWQFGIDYDLIGRNSSQDLFDSQLDVRNLLRTQSQMQWVIISTGIFTSFLFEPAFGIVNAARNAVTAIGSWENELTVTSPKSIGEFTAEIVLMHPDVAGVVYISDDTVSMARLADVVEAATGQKVKRELKTVAELKHELAQDPDDGMKKYRVVFGEGVGVAWSEQDSYNVRLGLQTQAVGAWAKANLN